MLCNRCLPFLRLQKRRQKEKSHISRNEVRNLFLKQKSIQERRLEKERFHAEDQAGLWKRKRCCGATGHLTLIQPKIPHVTQWCESIRSHDACSMYRVPQVPQKTQLSELSFLPSLAFLRIGNAEDVRLRFYRQFRLCITKAQSKAHTPL